MRDTDHSDHLLPENDNSPWLPGAHPNYGFPHQSAWGWNKAPPKTSLTTAGPGGTDQSGTAAAWILNVIEFAHWLTIVPTFLGSFAVMQSHDFWLNMFDGSELRVLLWCLAPIIGFVGGIPPIVMHTYESWQMSPFRNPVQGQIELRDYNNGWLRAIIYKFIFIIQGTALAMAYHGYIGFGTTVGKCTAGISLALILLAYNEIKARKPRSKYLVIL